MNITMQLALGLVLALGAPALKDKPMKEKLVLDGEWKPISFLEDGKPTTRDGAMESNIVFDEKAISVVGKQPEPAIKYLLNHEEKMTTIDFFAAQGMKQVLGIVKIEDKKLHLCFNKDGGPRPTEFASTKQGISYIILERVKKD